MPHGPLNFSLPRVMSEYIDEFGSTLSNLKYSESSRVLPEESREIVRNSKRIRKERKEYDTLARDVNLLRTKQDMSLQTNSLGNAIVARVAEDNLLLRVCEYRRRQLKEILDWMKLLQNADDWKLIHD